MSAFMVSETHVNYLVNAALNLGPPHGPFYYFWAGEAHYPIRDTQATVAMLEMANRESLQARYGDEIELEYTFRRKLEIDRMWALKACDCFTYQACEYEGWEKSQAYAFIQGLRGQLVHSLPGYDEAPWGIPDDTTHTVERIS